MSNGRVRRDNTMQVDLSGNFFKAFGLSEQFSIDTDQLVKSYRQLQQHLHPDRFVSKSEAERRWSMQAASFVNEGYQTLHDDLRRAGYLLQLNGLSIDDETDTQMDPMFLMEQMELRESLEMAEESTDPFAALADIRKQLRSSIEEVKLAFSSAATDSDWQEARTVARQWQFLNKLMQETKLIEERLDA